MDHEENAFWDSVDSSKVCLNCKHVLEPSIVQEFPNATRASRSSENVTPSPTNRLLKCCLRVKYMPRMKLDSWSA